MSLSFLKKTLLYRGRSAFSKNFIGLLRANAIGSALAFAVLPFLTRLYSPADFGALGLLVAVSGILMNVATYRFDWSMPNARSKTVAAGLFAWGLIALALVTAVIMTGRVSPALQQTRIETSRAESSARVDLPRKYSGIDAPAPGEVDGCIHGDQPFHLRETTH